MDVNQAGAQPGAGDGGAGGASLAGYEYQIDVSVWLALDLVVVSRLTTTLVLEPASQEDLEAELSDAEPARAVSWVALSGYTLIVQVKRRGGDAWTPTTLKTLLEHGSETRPSAATRLRDSNARYLLVTSAGLNGKARNLKVRRAGNWPKAEMMPGVIVDALAANAGGRVAVIPNEDDERLRTDIDRLLTEGCRVPNARLDACRRTLRDDARARIAGAGGGWWRREELEHVIREHGGYLASAPELEHYVHPTNWADLRMMMRDRSAALIIGQSGTGKTLATKKLYDELRQELPGLTRVPIRMGPHQLRDDQTPTPVLYDIEDPWGKFDFDPKSRPWNEELARFFADAAPGRMLVATSRLDVALAAKALDSVKPWVVKLEAEHYGPRERIQLYFSRIDGLPRELQALARGAARRVLDELATPLEIQKFFDALRTLDRNGLKNPPGFVAEAIRSAHQNSIESTVVNQIGARGDIRAAAVVWGLLKASDKLSRSVLREVEDGLADCDAVMERGVSPLADFFVAARNLRQGDGGILTYYHPRVEAGIEKAMAAHRQEVRHTLALLIGFLVSDEGSGGEWGAGAAARLLAAAGRAYGVKASPKAVARIDAWLEARLAEGGKSFEEHLELASHAGSSNSNGSEVARFLLHRPNRTFVGFMRWGAPDRPDAWYSARSADPSTRSIVGAFIREVLPGDRISYPETFVHHIERLATDLSGAFLDAADRVVGHGFIHADDAIATGALRDLQGFEAIVDKAVEAVTPTEQDLARAAEFRLDVQNDVYGDEHAQHLAEDDAGYTASVLLKAFVEKVRVAKGWGSIAQHPHTPALRPYWLNLLADEAKEGALDPEEVRGAFAACYGSDDEAHFWITLLRAWDPEYLGPLRDRVAGGHATSAVEQAALICLFEHAPGELTSVANGLGSSGATNRLIEIAIDLATLHRRRGPDAKRHTEAATAAAAALPPPYAEIADLALALEANEDPSLSDEGRAALTSVTHASEKIRRLRVEFAGFADIPVEDDVRWLLANSDDGSAAVLAIEAAIVRGMTDIVDAALDHRFAHVSARALTALGEASEAPLPQRLLDKASERGSPIRKALAALLKAKPHKAHLGTLIRLAQDSWSSDSRHYDEDADFPIAQDAVEALTALAPLPDEDAGELFAVGLDTADPDVRRPIFHLLAATGGREHQERLLDLAVRPGRRALRRAAAGTLLDARDAIDPAVIGQITASLLATRFEPVATSLALLLAARGDPEAVRAVAEELATNAKRRVLLLLLVWLVRERVPEIAQEIAAMLPAGHRAVTWALGEEIGVPDEALLADLGEPAICAQVLVYMKKAD